MSNLLKYPISQTMHTSRRRFLGWIGAGITALALPRPLWSVENPETAYRETIAVLTMLHQGEVEARQLYNAYKQQALKEGHVHIAHLFAAMAESEFVHEQRFREILAKLGVHVEAAAKKDLNVGSTRENLKYATEVELAEIDVHYPEHLARIREEKHTRAIEYITYAWKSERQHRELVNDIRSGTGIFFGLLAERFRSTKVRYFICQHCGSTLTVMPEEKCPVCGFAISWYKEIKSPSP